MLEKLLGREPGGTLFFTGVFVAGALTLMNLMGVDADWLPFLGLAVVVIGIAIFRRPPRLD